MKRILPLILFLSLVGCETNPPRPEAETKIAERVEYVVRIPPEEMTTLPVAPASIDVDTATQATVAQWLLDNETYINGLRNRLISIAKFLRGEQEKLTEQARKMNLEAGTLRPPAPAASAASAAK
jgi:hypothetical protein